MHTGEVIRGGRVRKTPHWNLEGASEKVGGLIYLHGAEGVEGRMERENDSTYPMGIISQANVDQPACVRKILQYGLKLQCRIAKDCRLSLTNCPMTK